MTTIVHVEYRPSPFRSVRRYFNSWGTRLCLSIAHEPPETLISRNCEVGAIVIGHGAPWQERCDLISHFKSTLPNVPIVASLRQRDEPFSKADYNCPADDPPQWVRTVTQALAGIA